jgi:hypothetical protein
MAPGRGHMDGAPRGRAAEAVAVKESRDAAAAAIDAEVFAGVVPPPMQTQIQRFVGMSSAVIGGFCEQHASPARRPRASGQVRRHDRQVRKRRCAGARVRAQRGHSIPAAPHTPAAGHRGMARLPRKQNRAPALRPAWAPALDECVQQAPDARRSRTEKNRARSYAPGTQGVGSSAAGHAQALWWRPPAPAARAAGWRWGRPDVGASLAGRAAATRR